MRWALKTSGINPRQRELLNDWRSFLGEFARSEYLSITAWSVIGLLVAISIRLSYDRSFTAILIDSYAPSSKDFDSPLAYLPYGLILLSVIAVAFLLQLPRLGVRGIRSWMDGVTSGFRK